MARINRGLEGRVEWVTIVAMVALLEYFFFGVKVGQARGKYGVAAPATTGNEIFERYFRVHMNTLEQLVIFLPALYGFAAFVSPIWAAVAGLVFVIGRALYYNGYIADPAKRGTGAGVTFLVNAVLVIGTIVGAVVRAM